MTSLGGGGGGGGGRGRFMSSSLSFPPSAPQSRNVSGGLRSQSSVFIEEERYLSELLAERQKLNPPVLPNAYRLLDQEILRVTILLQKATVLSQSGLDYPGPVASRGTFQNAGADLNGWASQFPSERYVPSSPGPNSLNSPSSSSGIIAQRTIRIDIPVERYPNYNFVGRLLGPGGNSLRRVEAITECRVRIRGKGCMKDQFKEEMMRGKPRYEHLNEPLHILVEATLPIEIVDARLMQAREILNDLLTPVRSVPSSPGPNSLNSPGSLSGRIAKRTIRIDIPVERYPNYNFVGRLLGPRGNSLRRVEASTDCRVLIRGRGCLRDQFKEEMMKGKPGYEHLNEPLHILVVAELPIEIVDARLMQAREILNDLLTPMEETHDVYRKEQLRELALLNGKKDL